MLNPGSAPETILKANTISRKTIYHVLPTYNTYVVVKSIYFLHLSRILLFDTYQFKYSHLAFPNLKTLHVDEDLSAYTWHILSIRFL